MKENTFLWGSQRRFNSYTEYFRKHFGGKVQKLTIDAGFSCPNRDGSIADSGCYFCNNAAFNPSYCSPEKSISRQIIEGIEFHKDRYRRADKYLAYFQAYSNTYGPVDHLKELYEEALAFPGIIGLVIGTRPDCINNEILNYLEEINKKAYLVVEYGIESCYDKTLKSINRGHDFKTSVDAVKMTAERGIRTGAHIIIGLPGESKEEILQEADILSGLALNNIKFHQLEIVKDTVMGNDYLQNPDKYPEFELDEYLRLMVSIIERLNPAFIVERIASETHPDYTLRSSWNLRYDRVLQLFEKKLKEQNTWQGKYFKNN